MEVRNLGIRLAFREGKAVLFFDVDEKTQEEGKVKKSQVLKVMVEDSEKGNVTLSLSREDAVLLGRKLLVGSIILKKNESMPKASSMVSFAEMQNFDKTLDEYFSML